MAPGSCQSAGAQGGVAQALDVAVGVVGVADVLEAALAGVQGAGLAGELAGAVELGGEDRAAEVGVAGDVAEVLDLVDLAAAVGLQRGLDGAAALGRGHKALGGAGGADGAVHGEDGGVAELLEGVGVLGLAAAGGDGLDDAAQGVVVSGRGELLAGGPLVVECVGVADALAERRMGLEQALANTRIEGHQPSEEFLADMAAMVTGHLSVEEVRRRIIERARAADRTTMGEVP